MPANFDPSADFSRVADNTEAVTLLRRGAASGEAGTVVLHVLRRATQSGEFAAKNRDESRRYVNSDGQCIAADVDWHLPAAELEAPPSIGDMILDGDGRRWTILELELIMLRTRWKCSARELTIAYGLDDTVVILKAEYAKSDAGAAEPAWQIWRTGVRARIQPVEVKVDVENSARCATSTYRIFLQDDLMLDHTHRIRGADGTVFQITAVTGSARLGELQTVEAVKV
ncbi:MAG: head-tail adaptor protein [Thermoguttaceae bacterium]|jgi:hypothetical protein